MQVKKSVDYIMIEVDKKTFNKILKERPQDRFARIEDFAYIPNRKDLDIAVPENDAWRDKLSQNNQFIRLIHNTWYMDITIKKVTGFRIHLGTLIDFTKQPINNLLK